MKNFKPQKQQGAVLVIALVMLLVLTVLAVSNMRGVALESRITANRIETGRLQALADAALREGEFRFYGSANLRDKLEPNIAKNCIKNNKLNRNNINRPCLLLNINDEDNLKAYFTAPISFFKGGSNDANKYANKTGAATKTAGADAVLAWMPYRGLDADEDHYFQSVGGINAYWNSYRVMSGSRENESVNSEYGAALEGKGTFFYLVTAQADDQIAAQSTIATIYLGLNN